MDRHKVQSGMIESIGYRDFDQRLEVEFKGGGVYQYANVPAATTIALLAAESVGSYFTQNIKGKYQYVKVAARGKDAEQQSDAQKVKKTARATGPRNAKEEEGVTKAHK